MTARPTFGVDRDPGVVSSFFADSGAKRPPLSSRPNPMVVALGPGPEGRVCGDCRHLKWKGGHSRRYYGCEERGEFSNGPATDHLVGWPACRSFEEDRG